MRTHNDIKENPSKDGGLFPNYEAVTGNV